MKNFFTIKTQLLILTAIILIVSAWRIYTKVVYLGFSLDPNNKTAVWQVEARIAFNAGGGPVKVSMATPLDSPGYKILEENVDAPGYDYQTAEENSFSRAEWITDHAEGRQLLYYRILVFDNQSISGEESGPPPPVPEKPAMLPGDLTAIKKIISDARQGISNPTQIVSKIIQILNAEPKTPPVKTLMPLGRSPQEIIKTATMIMANEGIASRQATGLKLRNGKRYQSADAMLEAYINGKWQIFNPLSGKPGIPDDFVLFRRGNDSLLDVEGGTKSSVHFSVLKSVRSSYYLAEQRALTNRHRDFFNLSVYSLPLAEQNAFKWLSILPLAILVIVILRNVIGITTMGTFTPILISMAFLETKLGPGLIYFAIIVTIGLLIRAYLSKLNLLLVPRISAVVIVVIIIMEAVSVICHQTGIRSGMSVTFFPLIIMAWVIERSSILWEEEGPGNALRQLGNSLFAAVIGYFIISNNYIQHVMFSFSEINLIILAAVMLLGTYTGYRLTELKRFKPLADHLE